MFFRSELRLQKVPTPHHHARNVALVGTDDDESTEADDVVRSVVFEPSAVAESRVPHQMVEVGRYEAECPQLLGLLADQPRGLGFD